MMGLVLALGVAGVARADEPPQQFRWYAAEGQGMSGPRLGVQVTTMTEELRQWFGAQPDAGVLIGKVERDSAAGQAGVRVGDVLVSVATQKIEDASDVRRALTEQKEGDLVEVTVVRDKRPLVLSARVPKAEKPTYTSGTTPPPEFFGALPGEMQGFFKGDFADRLKKIEERLEKLEKR